ncbi:Glycinol 4-dimethylallyltransferase, partial [Mucuna pruriens]
SYASKASPNNKKTQTEYQFLRFRQPSLNHHYTCIGGKSTYQEINGKYVVKVTPKTYSDSEPDTSHRKNISDYVKKFFVAFFMFSSPYAMTASTLSMISATLLAVEKLSDISSLYLIGVLQVVIPSFFMGIYIAGLNQLCDLEIDKINKPYLPLASGQISFTTGSFGLGWTIGSWPLIWSLLLSCLLWTTYSINVPLLRWKRYPLLAAMIIFATWAIIFPIPSFLHMQEHIIFYACNNDNTSLSHNFVFKRPTIFPRSLKIFVAFTSLYSVGIALFKDIPDIEGDTKFGIYSFSARLGPKWVFWICVSLFEMAFGVPFLAGLTSPHLWIKIVTGLGHAVLTSILWYQAKSTDLRRKTSIASFYLFIWKLLCAEYCLLP